MDPSVRSHKEKKIIYQCNELWRELHGYFYERRNRNVCLDNRKMTREELKQLLQDIPDGEIHLIEIESNDEGGMKMSYEMDRYRSVW